MARRRLTAASRAAWLALGIVTCVALAGACSADDEAGSDAAATPTTVDPVAAEVYGRACAECHGERGEGVERFGPALDPDALTTRFATLEAQVDFVLAGGEGGMPRFEGRLDRTSLTAAVSLTRSGVDALGPLPPEAEIDAAAVFADACASCHGAAGEGGVGPRLAGGEAARRFPDIEDQVDWVTFGGADMPAFRGTLSTAEIRAVVEYTRESLG